MTPPYGKLVEFEWVTYWEFEHEDSGFLPEVTQFGSEEAAARWMHACGPRGTLVEKRVCVVRRENGFWAA